LLGKHRHEYRISAREPNAPAVLGQPLFFLVVLIRLHEVKHHEGKAISLEKYMFKELRCGLPPLDIYPSSRFWSNLDYLLRRANQTTAS